MKEIAIIGLDLAKNILQVHGANASGAPVLKKRLRRDQALPFFARLPACTVAMEACSGAHYWAREIARSGHKTRLIPPAYVKPFVKRQKNGAADAEAICEAAQRPTMRFCAVKSAGQQAAAAGFRARDLLVRQRTQLINALRGHFYEYGIAVPKGAAHAGRLLELVDEGSAAPAEAALALQCLAEALKALEEKIRVLDREIAERAKNDALIQRLMTIPGIGAITATALAALAPPMETFSKGRDFAAWLGLVPKQHSSGGKDRLGKTDPDGRTLSAPAPGDRRGRCGSLGRPQAPEAGLLAGAHACAQAAAACSGRTCRKDGSDHLGLDYEGRELQSFERCGGMIAGPTLGGRKE
jgi:transposase